MTQTEDNLREPMESLFQVYFQDYWATMVLVWFGEHCPDLITILFFPKFYKLSKRV